MNLRHGPLLLLLIPYVPWVNAQQASFVWGFNDWTSTTLPQCAPLAIFVDGSKGTVKPSPPYYLIAYEENGVSSWSSIGSELGNLSWTVDHPAGSNLMLAMVDANGNSGGVFPSTYSIAGTADSTNASCLPSPARKAAMRVSFNTTVSTLDTCNAVRVNMTGGHKPYTLTVAEGNTASAFNYTLGAKDDVFEWVNNLSPGGQVILTVSDSTDSYGKSSSIITLAGDSNTHCSQQSRSSSSSASSSNNGKGSNSDNSSSGGGSKVAIIAGVIVALVFVGLMGFIAWFVLVRRRRRRAGREKGWTIDPAGDNDNYSHNDAGGGAAPPSADVRGRRGFAPMPSEADLTPYLLPGASSHGNRNSTSNGRLSPAPSGTHQPRSMRSVIGEEMLRDSSYYYGSESGYGYGYGERERDSAATPTSSHPFVTAPTTTTTTTTTMTDQNPFLQYGDAESEAGRAKLARYRDESPVTPVHSQTQSGPYWGYGDGDGSIRSRGVGHGFRAVNPDPDDFEARADPQVWRDNNNDGSNSGGLTTTTGRAVYQHQDAGVDALEEIPPAYPGVVAHGANSGGGGAS